ncbi:hypothetical protein Hanom_Chr03g00255201 [Helianthus anomalus]
MLDRLLPVRFKFFIQISHHVCVSLSLREARLFLSSSFSLLHSLNPKNHSAPSLSFILSLFFHLHNLPHLTDLTKLHHQEYHSRSLTRCCFMTRSVRISPDR